MFSTRTQFSERLKYDEKSFNQIVRQLALAGFDNIEIKIPNKGTDKFKKKIFSPEEFVKEKYNFVALILVAKNQMDCVKVLFVNQSHYISSFDDKAFPSGHSEAASYYIEVTDPVRLLGLRAFIHDTLRENSLRSMFNAKLQGFIYLFSSIYIWLGLYVALVEIIGKVKNGASLFETLPFLGNNVLLFTVLFLLSIVYTFYYITHPGGLYISHFEHPLQSFFRRLLVGDFKNNLLITFLFKLLKLACIAILTVLIGNTFWLIVEKPIKSALSVYSIL